jgi:hypothetical protein
MNISRLTAVLILLATVAALAQTIPPRTYTTPGFLKPRAWEGQSFDVERGGATPVGYSMMFSGHGELI